MENKALENNMLGNFYQKENLGYDILLFQRKEEKKYYKFLFCHETSSNLKYKPGNVNKKTKGNKQWKDRKN